MIDMIISIGMVMAVFALSYRLCVGDTEDMV